MGIERVPPSAVGGLHSVLRHVDTDHSNEGECECGEHRSSSCSRVLRSQAWLRHIKCYRYGQPPGKCLPGWMSQTGLCQRGFYGSGARAESPPKST